MEALTFKTGRVGMKRGTENEDFMFLNLGPNHPSAHGAFRIVLQLDGEERLSTAYQTSVTTTVALRKWRISLSTATFRILTVSNTLGGCVNEMPYVLAVENWLGSPCRIALTSFA